MDMEAENVRVYLVAAHCDWFIAFEGEA